jgi:hypothetical protein
MTTELLNFSKQKPSLRELPLDPPTDLESYPYCLTHPRGEDLHAMSYRYLTKTFLTTANNNFNKYILKKQDGFRLGDIQPD